MPSAYAVPLIALDSLPAENAVVGELLTATAVPAANVVRDIRENIRNLTGGRMVHYEQLVQSAIDAALTDLAGQGCGSRL